MNRKGFTLIELLAVIIIVAIIGLVAIPAMTEINKNSKLNSEQLFIDRLSQMIGSYVSLNSDNFYFTRYESKKVFKKPLEGDSVKVYKNENDVTFNNLIEEGIFKVTDYKNPSNKQECDLDAGIEIYRDSDFVYCYKVIAFDLGCISDEYIEEYLDGQSKTYLIDTCLWREEAND